MKIYLFLLRVGQSSSLRIARRHIAATIRPKFQKVSKTLQNIIVEDSETDSSVF